MSDLKVKLVTTILWFLFALLQYQLWFSQSSISSLIETRSEVAAAQQENRAMASDNDMLAAKVVRLQQDPETTKTYAREELGMIAPGEKFYFMPDP